MGIDLFSYTGDGMTLGNACRLTLRINFKISDNLADLDRGRERQRRRQNGVAYPYVGTTRYFHVVFYVRVLDVNLFI